MSCHIVYTLRVMLASSLDKRNNIRSRKRYNMKNLSACQGVSCFWLLLVYYVYKLEKLCFVSTEFEEAEGAVGLGYDTITILSSSLTVWYWHVKYSRLDYCIQYCGWKDWFLLGWALIGPKFQFLMWSELWAWFHHSRRRYFYLFKITYELAFNLNYAS